MKKFYVDFCASVIVEAKTEEEAMKKFYNELRETYEFVEIDCIEEIIEKTT